MVSPPLDDDLFRAVFEGALDALVVTDDEGTCLAANEAAVELFGEPESQLEGSPIGAVATGPLEFDAGRETFLRDGEPCVQFEPAQSDGEPRQVTAAVRAHLVPGICLVAFRAGTDRPTDIEALEAELTVFAQVLETSPKGVLLLDARGEILDANERAEEILEADRDDLVGRLYDGSTWAITDGSDTPLPDEELPVSQVTSTGATVRGMEHALVRADGTVTWLSVDATPIRNDGAEPPLPADADSGPTHSDGIERVVAVIEDVTVRKEYERLLALQNERFEEYSATVSHDLRSPMSIASGWIDIAIAEDSVAELEKARSALERMDGLISDLRTLGRYGQTVREMDELELRRVIEEAWENVDGGDNGSVPPDIDDDLGTMRADRASLLELFENLFQNSLEHAAPDVTIRVGPLDRGFYVEDDGPGIPEAKREEVFEFGYSTIDDGTGLGLAIVEAIAESHGWEYALTDADPRGARFEFRERWHPDRENR
jgi:PAS domain S-box-containing protein